MTKSFSIAVLALALSWALPTAGSAQPFTQRLEPSGPPTSYCETYRVRNNSSYDVQIMFDGFADQRYTLRPGEQVDYDKAQYCGSPAYVVASYSGNGRAGPIGRNLALDRNKPNYVVVDSGQYVFLIGEGETVPQ